jgi:hypothetical protein
LLPAPVEQQERIVVPSLMFVGEFDVPDLHIITDVFKEKIRGVKKSCYS